MAPTKQLGYSPRTLRHRATKLNPTPSHFHARRAKKHQSHLEDQYEMRFAEFDNKHGRAAQHRFPSALASLHTRDSGSYPYIPDGRPVNNTEIHGLVIGLFFLALLLGWFSYIGIRLAIQWLQNRADTESDAADIERGETVEEQPSETRPQSFVAKLRKVSADSIAELARNKSDIATGFKREMGELRRIARPSRPVDEEVGFGLAQGVGTAAPGTFLPAP
ncbi:hypothetical protein F5B20DRAFT_587892 [Whalleya microplaca]|nr:hypothetical protein F5B20DRAFT_587892 [Whalleya microplaca]